MPAVYPSKNPEERSALLSFIQTTPFAYGTWGEWKRLYKQIEADALANTANTADSEVLGALLARLDTVSLSSVGQQIQPVALETQGTVTVVCAQGDLIFVATEQLSRYDYNTGRTVTSGEAALSIYREKTDNALKPTFLGKIPGKYQKIAVQGNLLCLSNDKIFNLYGISEPENPKLLSKTTTSKGIQSILFVEIHLFVTQTDGIGIFSVVDPAQPEQIADFRLPMMQGQIAVQEKNEIALVRTRQNNWPTTGDVHVLDIRDVTKIKSLHKISQGEPMTMAFDGERILVVDRDSNYQLHLKLFDTAGILAEKKTLLGIIPLPSGGVRALGSMALSGYVQPTQILVRDGRALLASSGHLLDISNPMKPKQIGTHTVPASLLLSQNKRVYSTQYDSEKGQVVHAWQMQEGLQIQRIGAPPSVETLSYMKRRGRRLLQSLPATQFSQVAAQMLSRVPEITPQSQWISMDILFGGGKRFEQMSHGRKGYKAIGKAPMGRRSGEERFPGQWAGENSDRGESAKSLFQKPNLAWQTYEMALRICLNSKIPTPVMSASGVKIALESLSLPLIAAGARQVLESLENKIEVTGDVAALAFYKSIREQRKSMEPLVLGKPLKWQETFAKVLLTQVNATLEPGAILLTSRQKDSLALLGRHFTDYINSEDVTGNIPALLAAKDEALTALVVAAVRKAETVVDWENWITPLANVAPEAREPVLLILEEKARTKELSRYDVMRLTWFKQNAEVVRLGWRLVAAATKTKPDDIKHVWLLFLGENQITERLRGTMTSPYALALLKVAGIGNDELAEQMRTHPFLLGLLTEDVFANLVQTSPPDLLLSLSALAPDANWPTLKSGWLRNLREGVGVLPLWQALAKAFAGTDGGILAVRFAEDDDFITTFLLLEPENAEHILALSSVEMEPLVDAWSRKNTAVFTKDSTPLLTAATHTYPTVRRFALARVALLGMGLPFALRLLESEMPESVMVGSGFFAAIPAQNEQEVPYSLALCDSPLASVRKFGRQFVLTRWGHLPKDKVLSALFENPDPETQALVTKLLSGTEVPIAPTESAAFEGEVLRQKNRARKAKEIVKTRQDKQSVSFIDTPTLLALARGSRTPRDTDWALAQLTKRAMAGEKIEGLELSGL